MLKETLRAYIIMGLAVFAVMGLAFAEDSNITNNTTTSSTVSSNNVNTNSNTNNSVSQNTNINSTTINQTSVSTNTSSSENFNTNNSTSLITNNSVSDVTSDITQNVSSNVIQKNDSTSLSNNFNNNISSSMSSVETKNENINSSVNENKNFNQNNSNSNSNSRQVVTQRIKAAPPSAIAPSINSYSQLVCTSGASASIQTNLFGIASGRSIIDENCQLVLLSRELASQGMKVASIALLCSDPRVFRAMTDYANTPCPVVVDGKGLIGKEALAYWTENPEERPDWEEIKHKYDHKKIKTKAYKKKDFCRKYKSHKLCLD